MPDFPTKALWRVRLFAGSGLKCVPGVWGLTSAKVLGAVLDHGLDAVESACAEALEAGLASGDVILTVLARRSERTIPPSP